MHDIPDGTTHLFVDCDDTLILWADPVDGRLTSESSVNAPLVAAIKRWLERIGEAATLFVWSSGGQEWAAECAVRAGLPLDDPERAGYVLALAKYDRNPTPSDLYIDDDPLPRFAGRTIHPREFNYGIPDDDGGA